MARHATIDELLAVRDGEGDLWTKEHAATCADCSAELFRLEQVRAGLKALPTFAPPRDRWPTISAGAREDRRVRRLRAGTGLLAAAAMVALTFVALRPRADTQAQQQAALDRAMVRSQALEQTLHALQPETRALNGDAAAAVAELEDRLSRIDARLGDPAAWQGSPARAAQLWQQRAGVLSALVDVHVTRVAAAGL